MTQPIARSRPRDAELRVRAEQDVRTLSGYAAVFDSWTTLHRSRYWEVREIIRPGAFRNAIAAGQDVKALFNHNPDHVLGRTLSGTLRLREDARGLVSEFDPPDTELGRSVVSMVERGDVSQMSFAFIPRDGGEKVTTRAEGGLEITEVEITDVDLYDVAPVTYPAYQDTSIDVRGRRAVRRAVERWTSERRAKLDALARRARSVS